MRALIDWVLALMMICVALGSLHRLWRVLANEPRLFEGMLVAGMVGGFVALVWWFDHRAEERGWIVHHWWD